MTKITLYTCLLGGIFGLSSQDTFATAVEEYDIEGGVTGEKRDVFNRALKNARAPAIRQTYAMDADTLGWRSHLSLEPAKRELIRKEPTRIEDELHAKLCAEPGHYCPMAPVDRKRILPLITSLKNWLQTVHSTMRCIM